MVRVLVYSCSEYAWCLKPFLYLMDTYWSQEEPIVIGGCAPFPVPDNVTWLDVQSRIKARWSDGLIECLNQMDDEVFVWMLEDYWLCRRADNAAVDSLADYARMHTDVLKIDLTADRLHSGAAMDVDYWGHCDIIDTPWSTPWRRTWRGPPAAIAKRVSRHADALEPSRSHSHVKNIVQRRGRGGRSRGFLTKCQPTERTTMARSIRKRSVIIAGHRSSVSLEPEFWEAFLAAPNDAIDDDQSCHSPWFDRCCREKSSVSSLKRKGDWDDMWFQMRPRKTINYTVVTNGGQPPTPAPTQIQVAHFDFDTLGLRLLAPPIHHPEIVDALNALTPPRDM